MCHVSPANLSAAHATSSHPVGVELHLLRHKVILAVVRATSADCAVLLLLLLLGLQVMWAAAEPSKAQALLARAGRLLTTGADCAE